MSALAAVIAGPLVGVAAAAAPTYQPNATASTPKTATTAAAAPYVNAFPTTMSLKFDAPVNSPTYPVPTQRSSIALFYVGGTSNATCTNPQVSPSDNTVLQCTASNLKDGLYRIDFKACAVLPDTSCGASQSVYFGIDTTKPALVSRSPRTAAQTAGLTVSATYSEALDSASSDVTVKNINGNTVAGTTSVTGSTITWTPAAPLPAAGGPYAVTTDVSDLHTLTATDAWSFVVDNTAPPAPTFDPPSAYINSANVASFPISGTVSHSTGDATSVQVTASVDGGAPIPVATLTPGNGTPAAWSTTLDLSPTGTHATPIPDGVVTFSAVGVDDAGNVSPATTVTSTKDTVAPTLDPAITLNPTSVNSSSSTVAVSGVAEHAAGIAVSASNGPGTATTPVVTSADDGTGAYDAVVDTKDLNDGTLTVSVVATDAAGNTTTRTTTLSKDTVAPGTPAITTFGTVNSGNVSTPRPISGTVANSPVSLDVWVSDKDGTETPHVPVTPSAGTFSTSIDVSSLVDGPITAHAVAIDDHGNRSAPGTAVATKDVAAPAAPDYSPTMPAFVNQANASAFPVSGTAEPGSSVAITVADAASTTTSKTVPTDGSGAWATTFNLGSGSGYVDGAVSISSTATDAAGNTSVPAGTSVTRDTVPPATPGAPAMTDASSGSPSTLTGTQLSVTGSGADGDTMLLTLVTDGGPGQVTKSATAGGSGYTTPVDVTALPDGQLSATAVDTDPAGNSSAPSAAATIIKDTTPIALVSTSPANGSSVRDLSTVSATYNEQLDRAASSVTLSDDSTPLSTSDAALSADRRTISITPTDSPLAEGSYTAVFTVHDRSGAETTSSPITFTVDRTPPAAPVVGGLATANAANVAAVPVTGSASESTGEVVVAVTDGSTVVSKHVPLASGTWSTAIDLSSLNDGPISATATEIDEAGNTSASSDALPGIKDTVAPAAPTLGWSGPVTVAHHTVTLSGAGVTGTELTVSVDDSDAATAPVVTTTPVSSDAWSVPVDLSSLSDSTLTATAWETDAAGNPSTTVSDTQVKDTVPAAAPDLDAAPLVNVGNASALPLSGTGTTGDTVSVVATDGTTTTPSAEATVVGGIWSTTLDVASLSDGVITISATASDPVGNTSAPGAVDVTTKDTAVPQVHLSSHGTSFTLGKARLSWTGSDAGSGVTSYDVMSRQSSGGAWSAWRTTSTTTTSVARTLTPGETMCFVVIAHDGTGNTSLPAGPRCISRAFDDRALSASSGWTRVAGARFYRGTASFARSHGATLRLGSMRLDRIALVVEKCPGCGSVTVKVGRHAVKTIDLAAAQTRERVMVALPKISLRTAAIRLVVASSGKPVRIDGLGVTRA
jgi:methionine-rich copper-binding protein CopC